jgi:hypothetical protein
MCAALALTGAACGGSSSSGSSDSSSPRRTDGPTTTVERARVVSPTKLLLEPVQLSLGEAVRFSARARSEVDVYGFLAVSDATMREIASKAGDPAAAQQQVARSNDAWAQSRFQGDVPADVVLLFSTSADNWDDRLAPGSSAYEVRQAWVAPASGTYYAVAFADDATDIDFELKTSFDESAIGVVSRPDIRSMFDPERLATLFPMYNSFLAPYTGSENEAVAD